MRNKIKGIIVVRENTDAAPRMHKINGFFIFLINIAVVFFVVSLVILVSGWSFITQRLITYSDMQIKNDSLIQYSMQVDSLKTNIMKINRYLEYFKMISALDNVNTPPTIDEYLKDKDLIASFEMPDTQREFRKIPQIRPVVGIISRSFDKSIGHESIDFTAPLETPIRATADGEVKSIYFAEDIGKVVVLKHSDGYETLYAHCLEILVKEGQTVVQGETIALVGNSGKTSSGAHLHYEISKDGKNINPENLFL